MNKTLSKAIVTIVFSLAAVSANAVNLSSSPVNLYDLFPSTTQGENGITLMSLFEPTGTYNNLNYRAPSIWVETYPSERNVTTIRTSTYCCNDIQFTLPLVYPYGSGLDAVMKVNVTGGFNTLRIDQTIGAQGGGSGSEINFSIYEGSSNFDSPLWSGKVGRGVSSSSSVDLAFNSGSDYYFRVNTIFNDVDTQTWKIAMTGVSPIPEADTSAMLLTGLGVIGFVARRRKHSSLTKLKLV